MSFDWQPLDEAARTLGTDPDTLRQWIDDGRAPTRIGAGGVTEVLIEFPDDDDADPDEPASADDVIDVDDVSASARSSSEPQPIQVVPRHEMQLAGAMAAAWQRMAEHSEAELTRSRKVSTIAYVALALLVVLAAVGLWYATAETTKARGQAESTAEQLREKIEALDIATKDKTELTTKVDVLQSELTTAKTDLATATERATQLTAAAEQTAAQHKMIVESLESQIADLRKQLDRAAADLKSARSDIDKLEKSRSDLESRNKKLAEEIESLKTKLAEASKQLQESPAPPGVAPAPDDNLFEGTAP